ncbi:MAG: hypothetical protein IKN17_08630 [Ruminococcus sp.]|nr:hypothetical protein [Ruminococcus sp.]
MEHDFTPYLMAGEQIMWQGKSHKEGPPVVMRSSGNVKAFAIIWLLMCSGMFIPVIFLQISELSGGVLAGFIVMFIVFEGLGIWLLIYAVHYTQEYYCITDKRFIVMLEDGRISMSSELSHVLSAEITGIENGYGTISMKTDIVRHTRIRGHRHTMREYWSMRGVDDPSECFRILTGILQINDEYRFIR